MAHQFFIYYGEPMGKPRMTRQDVWKKRKCVVQFRAYADKLRHACNGVDQKASSVSWNAFFNITASWPDKKKRAMAGQPHRQKPDRDNIDKGILDALFKSDCGIAMGSIAKFWDDGLGARLEITIE